MRSVGTLSRATRLSLTIGQTADTEVPGLTAARRPPRVSDWLDRPRSDEDDEPVGATAAAAEDPGFARAEAAWVVNDLLAGLPEREQAMLYLRFELDLTQAEIGRRMGVSQMHVSRVIRQAIERLQRAAAPSDDSLT